MATVSVSINNRSYSIGCDDGQEEHLTRLADYLDKRVQELAGTIGQIGDSRLLVIAGLLISDELSDAYSELDTARHQSQEVEKKIRRDAAGVETRAGAACQAITDATQRIEALAARLEDA